MTEKKLRALELPAKFKNGFGTGYTRIVKFVGNRHVVYEDSDGVEHCTYLDHVIMHWTHIKHKEKVRLLNE